MDYRIDRSLLESKSSEEIRRILKHERDDYTPEAIQAFKEILAQRGEAAESAAQPEPNNSGDKLPRNIGIPRSTIIRNPSDAVRLLNELLSGVLNGTVDPKVAEVSTNLVMAILRAMEQEFMTESEED